MALKLIVAHIKKLYCVSQLLLGSDLNATHFTSSFVLLPIGLTVNMWKEVKEEKTGQHKDGGIRKGEQREI